MTRRRYRPLTPTLFVLLAVLPVMVGAADDTGPGTASLDFAAAPLEAEHSGELAYLVDDGVAEPLSLATADLDQDGMPDLVVGYGAGNGGVVALYRGNLEAVYPRPGEPAGEPFLPVAEVFATALRPDIVGAGDFDADGRFDVVVGSLGATTLALHRGDGRGGFAEAEPIELGGRLTAMAVGEVNRRDGLADVVVGIDGWQGPRLLVFEWPEGALRGLPEAIDAPALVTDVAIGSFDDDGLRDIVGQAGDLIVAVSGRDRRLSLGQEQRFAVGPPQVATMPLGSTEALKMAGAAEQTSPALQAVRGTIVDHIEMRLNRDAIPDTVVVIAGQQLPVVVKSLSRTTFTVSSIADDPDFSTADGVCDTDDSIGDGPCTLRAAIQQANASAGADSVEFDIAGTGPHTIQPLSELPTVTEALTIDGTTEPDFSGTPIVELDGSAASGSLNGLVISGGSSVVRGLVINRMKRDSNIYHGSAIFLDVAGGNIVEGNFLGTDPSGTTLLSNEFYGILGFSGSGNVYGGTVAAARNVISGQFLNMAHREGTGILIQGNFIGTDVTGTVALNSGSDYGIDLWSNAAYGGAFGGDHTVGGTTAGAGNLISGEYVGVNLRNGTSGNLIQGNSIGTDITGTLPLPCSYRCVSTWDDESDTIGGTTPAARNLISVSPGAYNMAIAIQEASDLLVQGNFIGVDITGVSDLPCANGVYVVMDSTGTSIGGALPGSGNVIAGCSEHGVWLNIVSQVTVQGNSIGVDAVGDPLGNGMAGVGVYQCDNLTIGGSAPGEGNTIAYNGEAGVAIGELYQECGPGVTVVGNSIHSNVLLGIDLESDGVTANDAGDGDTGSNGWQNFPVITGVTSGGSGVNGTLNSLPSTQYELAFYATSVCDPSGNGEGEVFLSTDTVTTDATGDASFSTVLATPIPAGTFVTATATAPDGSTSEFSACYEYQVSADLAITKDDGVTQVLPGDAVTYTIVASNVGPDDVLGATVEDTFSDFLSCTWTCVAAAGASCTAGPFIGNLEDLVDLPVGGTATYTAVCGVDHTATGTLENTVEVVPPDGMTDPNSANNSASDEDLLLELDYGDAPDPSYPTLWDSDGARHLLGGALFLGATVDADPDGQPDPGAAGDDGDGSDDEDGVRFTSVLMSGFDATVEVTASAAGWLNAWLDLNADGDWDDAGEQIFADEPMAAGITPLTLAVPPDATLGGTYARFRIDSAGGLTPAGLADDGEVEDELVQIRFSTLDVPETGQTISYAAGDDGTFQVGVPWPSPRFTDNGDGTLNDELTGLMWTQDSVNPGPPPCSPGVTRDWYGSLAYVDCLNANSWLGHDDWRMPNVVEMNSLMSFAENDNRPWWAARGFTATTNYRWWSSTTMASGLGYSLSVTAIGHTSGYGKLAVSGTAVWPVRGGGPGEGSVQLPASGQVRCWDSSFAEVPCDGTGQDGDHRAGAPWPEPRFEVTGDCATDRLTGLMWTTNQSLFGTVTWDDALGGALGLSLCGFDDWRLPSATELRTLWNFDKRSDPVAGNIEDWWTGQGFVNVTRSQAWSGTSDAGNPAIQAWAFYNLQLKSNDQDMVVWPVRGNLQVLPADLAVAMTDSADPVVPGTNVTYTVELSNLGPNAADEAAATLVLPDGAVFVSASGTGWSCGEDSGVVSCTTPTLPVGSAEPITVEITSPSTPGITLSATVVVDSARDDPQGDNNGDVETTTLVGYDYGDAPDPSYPTLIASDGARHLLGGTLFLGASIDSEPDGLPTAGADGDDLDGTDDEDGVAFTSALQVGFDAAVDVTASAAGVLNAWLDLNADGDWNDPGEQVVTDTTLTAGINNLVIPIPLDAAVGTTFARFRLDSTGGLAPTGLAADGEVEDYAVVVEPSAELAVSVADSPDPAVEGGSLTYLVNLANNGALDATGVVVTDTLPPEVVFADVTPGAPTCTESAGVVTCDLGTLTGGAATQVVVTVDVPYGTTGTLASTAAVTLDQTDPVTANNTEVETTQVVADADHIFSDGVETGTTDRWFITVP